MTRTPSPKILIDAANGPVEELPPVGMRPDKPHVARPWGFKGTMVKADDWNTKQPHIPITPHHWKFLTLERRANGYTLLSFATNGALLKGDLRILKIPTSTRTYALELEGAVVLGEKIEEAFRKLRRP